MSTRSANPAVQHKHIGSKLALWLSALCAVHCLLTPLLVILLPNLGASINLSHEAEWIIIGSAAFFGGLAVWHGYQKHHRNRLLVFAFLLLTPLYILHEQLPVWAMIPVLVLFAGLLLLNWRMSHS